MLRFNNVLIPVDYSDFSRKAIRACSTLFAGDERVAFHFVHVWRSPSDQSVGDALPDLQAELDEFVSEFTHAGDYTAHTRVLMGDPATAICDYAREMGCDVVAMATHGRTGLAHLLIGSTTEHVVRHAPCPVLTLRVSAEGAEPGA